MELDLISVGYEICWVMYEHYSLIKARTLFSELHLVLTCLIVHDSRAMNLVLTCFERYAKDSLVVDRAGV